MKFLTVLFFLILSLAGFAAAQDNSDKKQKFNGIWIFDAKKSDVGSNGKRLYKGQILEISYNEPELKIAKTQTMEGKAKTVTLLFYTDNRGEKNKPYPFNETLEIASNTAWSKDTIVRKFTINVYNSGNLTSGLKNQETYIISEDGETLTIIEEMQPGVILDSSTTKTDQTAVSKRVYKRKK